jgi:hypothetical protein
MWKLESVWVRKVKKNEVVEIPIYCVWLLLTTPLTHQHVGLGPDTWSAKIVEYTINQSNKKNLHTTHSLPKKM